MLRKFFAIGIGFMPVVFPLVILIYQAYEISLEPMNLWSDRNLTADCGIVLTGAPGRVREAFEQLDQKKIRMLIVSGVYKEAKLPEVFPYLPFYPNIDVGHIALEKKSETTYGNAQQSSVLAENLKCRSVLLMTSQIHMRRSYRIFRKTFSEAIPIYKLSLPNSKYEIGLLDLSLESLKSILYLFLTLFL